MQELITFINHHLLLSAVTAIVLLLVLIVEMLRAKRRGAAMTPARVTQMINREQAVILDLRAQEIFRKGHIIDAISMTPQEVQENSKKLEKYKNKPIVLVCAMGMESQKTAALLQKQGYNVCCLSGGMRAWTNAEMPVVKE
jgi:rhodanese-related sulfurtransferase